MKIKSDVTLTAQLRAAIIELMECQTEQTAKEVAQDIDVLISKLERLLSGVDV